MATLDVPAVAIIADAHFHDTESHYDYPGTTIDGRQLTLRSWADTKRSSRVFNESGAALRAALDDVQKRRIRHVVLLGDYTDDGQIECTKRLADLLQAYHYQYDMAFYAIPGNHDVYGSAGKHQSTRFVSSPGQTVLVTSKAAIAQAAGDASVLTPRMYRQGAPDGLLPMAKFGLFKQPDYIHWETPFGQSDSPDSRLYDISSPDGSIIRQLMDASYLVEPATGLWLLMIDANVYEPRNGQWKPHQKNAFFDSSDAGWNSVLHHRPYLLKWIADVCLRAKRQGKHLLAFSHYPIIDPFDDSTGCEATLFGSNSNTRRKPAEAVAEKLLAAGLTEHFGGHLHVNGCSHRNAGSHKINHVSVPSLVAFPACYKIVHCNKHKYRIDTVQLSTLAVDQRLLAHYRAECRATGESVDPALAAKNYGEFLYLRMYSYVKEHLLPKEWPDNIAAQLSKTNAGDLACFMLAERSGSALAEFGPLPESNADTTTELRHQISQQSFTMEDLQECSMINLVVDWYCLRQSGHIATAFIPPNRLRIYQYLAQEFGAETASNDNSPTEFFSLFLGMLEISLRRAMHVDRSTGTTSSLQ